MRPVLFHLGALAVSSFWVAAFLGFFAAFLVTHNGIRRRGYDVAWAYDLTLYVYIGGWVGARLFLIPTGWDLFTEDPIGFLLSSSGWVWYGGVVGGTVGAWCFARQRRVSLLVLADIIAPALAIGHGIGRIGCQLAGDGDYGLPTNLPWGMSYPNGVVPTVETVHPAPIYEMLACFAIFAYLWRRQRKNPPSGDLIGRYLILAAATRFLIEFIRRNPAWLAGLTTAQWMSISSSLIGVVLLWRTAHAANRVASSAVRA
ncbi:MAG: prolipoprotein diacylglyceryl transferase [Candidatus Binatia bacterium]